jgi:hypothetical protein
MSAPVSTDLLLLPLLAQVLLTAIVWVALYVTRLREIRIKRIEPQRLADSAQAERLLKDVAGPSENFVNLFETPVLFYAAILLLYASDRANLIYLWLAWGFVLLRYAHSLIHITYNRVLHRFFVYMASTLFLWALWIALAADIIAGL